MTHPPLKVSDYDISEEHLENVAREFYGDVKYPAGNHQEAWISFPTHGVGGLTACDYRQQFLAAMQSYRRPGT